MSFGKHVLRVDHDDFNSGHGNRSNMRQNSTFKTAGHGYGRTNTVCSPSNDVCRMGTFEFSGCVRYLIGVTMQSLFRPCLRGHSPKIPQYPINPVKIVVFLKSLCHKGKM